MGGSNTWIKIPLPTSLQSVVFVKLRLYVWSSSNADMSTISISSPTQSWNHKQITWDTEPTTFNKTRNITFEVVNEGWLDIDITDFAGEWLSGDLPNNGLRLSYVDVTSLKEIYFHSSRYSNQSLRPHIVIEGTFSNSNLHTKTALGDLGGLPWLGGVIPQGTHGLYAVDGYFQGDITGASGTFQGAVKSVDAEGNYSLLDSGRLSFYRRIGEDEILSYYVAQIATGQAVDGEVVDLEALGYRFFQPPKIVLQPKLNRVFVANAPNNDIWMDWGIEDQTFNPETGAVKFKVRARTIVKGGTVVGSFTPSKLESKGASTVTTTGPGTTFLSFKVSGYAYQYAITGSIRIEFRIQYRKIGTSTWTTLDNCKYSKSALFSKGLEILETLSYNVPDSGSTGYEVRVILDVLTFHDPNGSRPKDPHLTILEFSYRSNDTILTDPANPEVVSWIAIDGG